MPRLVIDHSDDAAWDRFAADDPAGHLLQSSSWARFRSSWGWEPRRVVVVHDDGRIVAGAQLLVRQSPLPLLRSAYVPRGPVVAPPYEAGTARDTLWPMVLAGLREIAPDCTAIRIEPSWPSDPGAPPWLSAQGLVEVGAVQPRSSVVLDLRQTEQELLAAMKPKWRYNVGLAGRRGVTVREGVEDDLATFGRLMDETAERDGFQVRPTRYYADAWRAFQPDAHLFVAEVNATPVAALMSFHFGPSATYLYGASSARERARMPNHLLQWHAIRAARADGRLRYDFWGIPDAVGRAAAHGDDVETAGDGDGDGLWGVWGFKRGFGGAITRTVGAWDIVQRPTVYRAGRWAQDVLGRLRA